jgi:TRAP transporter TAXI family solute receptor
MRFALMAALGFASLAASFDMSQAQTAEKRGPLTPREKYREQVNENVLYLMGGQLGAAYVVIAHDISVVVNDGDNLRVLPVIGGAAVQNLRDVVFLRGIDLGVTNLLTLNQMKASGELGANLDKQVAYITPLFPEALQILVRPGIGKIEDLKGKKVSFNSKGSGTAQFAPVVFKTLGVEVEELFMPQGDAIEKMRSGEIEATVCTCPVPIPTFPNVKQEWGFKLLPVPYTQALEENYYPARIGSEEYPNLIAKDTSIETIATSSVLISFNWQPGSIRYNRITRFVDAMFSRFAEFRKPPRHPLWHSVNLAGTVRGWPRFPAAQEWLDKVNQGNTASLRTNFTRFLGEKQATERDAAAQEKLFQNFLEWTRNRK